MKAIRNILFDLGGVLIDIDYDRPVQAFSRLGYEHFERYYSQVTAGPLFTDLETGRISSVDFYRALGELGGGGSHPDQLEEAWNSILLGFRLSSLQALPALRTSCRLFLLSNTNEIHHRAFMRIFSEQVGRGVLDDYFDQSFYSHLIGCRKPNADAYEFVLKNTGIAAEETLFIDDTLENTEAAEKIGFQTHTLLKGERIEDLELLRPYLTSSKSM